MTHRLSPRLVALALPVVALLAPSIAHAEKVVTRDVAGDVVQLIQNEDGSTETLAAPDYAGADIVRTVVDHRTARLRVSVRFRELRRDPFHFTIVRVLTPRGKYDLTVERLGGKPIVSLMRGKKDVECRALKARVDRGTRSVTASLPTSCLDAPRWVQVGVGAVAVDTDSNSDSNSLAAYADDGHRDGDIRESSITKGPKVHRG